MITVNPQGLIYLCKTPLENDYKNQLTFTNIQNQKSYFNSVVEKSFDNYTYIKQDNTIKVGENIDNIINCNYLFYQNVGFSNRTYYCFITNMEYINENCTLIQFETDVYQTYLFDLNYKRCFVEREHVNNDTIGLHTIDENIDTGDYIVNNINKTNVLEDYVIIVASTIDLIMTTSGTISGLPNGGGTYNGVKSGYRYYVFENNANSRFGTILQLVADMGKLDAIGTIFMSPKWLVPVDTSQIASYDNKEVKETYIHYARTWDALGSNPITKPTNLNGYVPKNRKMFTYPYCYLNMTNNNGGNALYKYELFNNPSGYENECTFDIFGALSPSMDIICVPANYNGSDENYSEALSCGKFPICGWQSDTYTNWLTQNAVNIGVSLFTSSLSIAGGVGLISSGAGATAGASQILSGSLGVASILGQNRQHKLVPSQAEGNTNTGNIQFALNNTTFSGYQMSIKQEYAKIIDDYFTMYGYKVNSLKIPNITGRRNWNYVKTIDCNFEGDIPQKDLNIIKQMFNNGVTLWHNPTTMLDYSQNNSII